MTGPGNAWMDDMKDAFIETARRNRELWRRGTGLLRRFPGMPPNVSRLATETGAALSKGLDGYLRLTAAHISRLLDLEREVSGDLFASLARAREHGAELESAPEPAASELVLKGFPGDLCRSAFILESKKSAPVRARVSHSRFVNTADGSAAELPLAFDPPEATVAPGEKIRIAVEAAIPEKTPAGTYHSHAWIEGFPELLLRVVLSALPEPEARAEEPSVKKGNGKRNKR